MEVAYKTALMYDVNVLNDNTQGTKSLNIRSRGQPAIYSYHTPHMQYGVLCSHRVLENGAKVRARPTNVRIRLRAAPLLRICGAGMLDIAIDNCSDRICREGATERAI
jgi:hypothetical protein